MSSYIHTWQPGNQSVINAAQVLIGLLVLLSFTNFIKKIKCMAKLRSQKYEKDSLKQPKIMYKLNKM